MFYAALILFVLSGLGFLFGIFSPDHFVWGKKKSRLKVIMTYIPVMAVTFIAVIALSGQGITDKVSQIEAKVNQVDTEKEDTNKAEANPNNSDSDDSATEMPVMKVNFLDVGQADAAVLQYEDDNEDYNVLIDTGDWTGNETVDYLNEEGIDHIDLMALSHEHADHIGQADKIINQADVDEVWLPGNEADTQVYDRVMDSIDSNNVDYNEPRAGEDYQVGPLDVDVVSPQKLTGDLNDDSIVMRLTYGDVTFLFTGDAELSAEESMLESDNDLSADILKVGHHGSHTSSNEGFIQEVDPDVAVISVGEDNEYGHPSQSVLSRFERHDIETFMTKDDGTVTLKTNGVDYDIE